MEIDVPRPLPIVPTEILVPFRPLVPRVARQYALQAHAHALDALHGAPAGFVEQIQADDAIAVDVRMHGNAGSGQVFAGHDGDEHDFGCFNGVFGAEAEAQVVGFVEVDGVGVEDLDFHEALGEIIAVVVNPCDTRWGARFFQLKLR